MVAMVGLEPTQCLHQRILSPPRLPIPPHRHMCGFLEAPRNLNLIRILGGALPIQQHHWTTRISGWVVVIISPVYSLAPHTGPATLPSKSPNYLVFPAIPANYFSYCQFHLKLN